MLKDSKTDMGFLTVFLKSTRPSLPLKKAPPLISVFFNSLYDPFGSPCRGQKRCSNRCAIRMADHQKSALVFCAGWDRLAVLLGPLPSGEETILQKGLYTLL